MTEREKISSILKLMKMQSPQLSVYKITGDREKCPRNLGRKLSRQSASEISLPFERIHRRDKIECDELRLVAVV